MKTTTYADGHGNEHAAILLTWDEVEEILGVPHDGRPSQDEALVTRLRDEGAPAWVEDAEGWVDERGWGLIGPRSFGGLLRDARLDKDWSQTDLAAAIGTDQPRISRLEAGETEPKARTIRKLATALDVSADYLLGISERKEAS